MFDTEERVMKSRSAAVGANLSGWRMCSGERAKAHAPGPRNSGVPGLQGDREDNPLPSQSSGSQANTKRHGCEPVRSLRSPFEELLLDISRMEEKKDFFSLLLSLQGYFQTPDKSFSSSHMPLVKSKKKKPQT